MQAEAGGRAQLKLNRPGKVRVCMCVRTCMQAHMCKAKQNRSRERHVHFNK